MDKRIFLITPGHCEAGYDPKHTNRGFLELAEEILLPVNFICPLVVVGTGQKFKEIFQIFDRFWTAQQVRHDPRVGSAGQEKIADFNAWEFVDQLPHDAVICGGSELMMALGLARFHRPATVFEIFPETKGCKVWDKRISA